MMDPTTQANINAGVAVATSVAPAFGPVAVLAVGVAAQLLAAATASQAAGRDMTIEDFNAAVVLDDAAIEDDVLAQAEALAKGQK